jgi:hypothetical protein
MIILKKRQPRTSANTGNLEIAQGGGHDNTCQNQPDAISGALGALMLKRANPAIGNQYRRSCSPIGVSGPTLVGKSFRVASINIFCASVH